MKRLLLLLTAIAMCVASCNHPIGPDGPDNPDGPGTDPVVNPEQKGFAVDQERLEYACSGGTATITVTPGEEKWDAVQDARWCTISISGNAVEVTVEQNVDQAARFCNVIFTSGSETLKVEIAQAGDPDGGAEHYEHGEVDGAEYNLTANTFIAPAGTASRVSSVTNTDFYNNTLLLPLDYPLANMPKEGEGWIVNEVSEALPQGLLAYINSVTKTDGGYLVNYQLSTVTSLFKDLEIPETEIDLASHIDKILDSEGNPVDFSLGAPTKASAVVPIEIPIPSVALPIGDGFEFTPIMKAALTLKMQMTVGDWSISTLNFVVDSDLEVGADIAGKLEMGGYIYKRLFDVYLTPIPVGPILVTPMVGIDFVFNPTGKISLHATATYRQSYRTSFHYDEINGVSLDWSSPDPETDGWKPVVAGPKVEGSFSYGLGVAPRIGIFGDAISAHIGLSAQLKHSVATEWNVFADPAAYGSDQSFAYRALVDGTFNTSFTSHLYGGMTFLYQLNSPDVELPDVDFEIDSRNLVPMFDISTVKCQQDGGDVIVDVDLKNRHFTWLPMRVEAMVYEDGEYKPVAAAMFDMDQEKSDALNAGAESVTVQACLKGLEPNKVYYTRFSINPFDTFWAYTDGPKISPSDERVTEAIRGILSDLLEARSGEWPGCNWDDPALMLSDYADVESGEGYCNITIPSNWALKSDIHVRDHSSGIQDFGRWSLTIAGTDNRNFDSITVDDRNCYEFFAGDKVRKYAIHSDKLTRALIPDEVEILDLGGCRQLESFNIYDSYECNKIKELILDGCTALPSCTIKGNTSRRNAPKVSTEGCTALKDVQFYDLAVDQGDIDGIELTCPGASLTISNCDVDVLSFGMPVSKVNIRSSFKQLVFNAAPTLEKVDVFNATGESITVSNCPNLKVFDAYNNTLNAGGIGAISVTDCPLLESLKCYRSGLSSFEASGLPSIRELDCGYNDNLSGVMLPIFDEMYDKGLQPRYDQRYYSYYNDEYKDLGYGWYYEGEPERGYHRK